MRSSFYAAPLVFVIAFIGAQPVFAAGAKATLEDLKKLEIICFVPGYLPKGFHLEKVEITQEEDPSEAGRKFPMYSVEYSGSDKASFSIESAREGIGDRNIMETDNAQEKTLESSLFGPVYIIYTPKEGDGKKGEIIANWVKDANMLAETATNEEAHPVLGRFHGFSAAGMTVAEYEKMIASLHPVKPAAASKAGGASAATVMVEPKLHPKIFSMIESWISDGESPVVTEINLNAVRNDDNQFQKELVKEEDGWRQCPGNEPGSFMRYRLLESKGNRFKAEYQENGGGSLTIASTIEFTIERREITRDGQAKPITVLRVISCQEKK